MKELRKFDNYEDLKKYIGADGIYSEYAETELSDYLGCIGSNTGSFELQIDDREYVITVNSYEVEEDRFKYEYEVFEISQE